MVLGETATNRACSMLFLMLTSGLLLIILQDGQVLYHPSLGNWVTSFELPFVILHLLLLPAPFRDLQLGSGDNDAGQITKHSIVKPKFSIAQHMLRCASGDASSLAETRALFPGSEKGGYSS